MVCSSCHDGEANVATDLFYSYTVPKVGENRLSEAV